MKIVLILVVVLLALVGGAYGLAKIQVIPTQKMASKNPALARALQPLGLYTPPAPPPPVAPATPVISPEQQALNAERAKLEKEKADFQQRQELAARAKKDTTKGEDKTAIPDPQSTAKLASIFEQMPAAKVSEIFKTLPPTQVVALMRIMDEKKVSDILALQTPEKATEYTKELVKAAPDRTASAAP